MSPRVSFPSVAQGKHIEKIRQLGPDLTAQHCSAFSQHTIFPESLMNRDFEIITFSQHFVE